MATLLFSLEELAHREGLAVAPAPAAWSLRFRLKFQLGNRERSAEGAGFKSHRPTVIVQALLALTTRPGEEAETVAYLVEVTPGFGDADVGARGSRNDRGAALLIASNLENSLRIAIEGGDQS